MRAAIMKLSTLSKRQSWATKDFFRDLDEAQKLIDDRKERLVAAQRLVTEAEEAKVEHDARVQKMIDDGEITRL